MEKKVAKKKKKVVRRIVDSDRLTYSETRKINMGDYETTSMGFTFSTSLNRRPYSNKMEASITETATKELTNSSEKHFQDTGKELVKRVRSLLDSQELVLRNAILSNDWSDDDVTQESKRKDLKKRMKLLGKV